MNYSSLDTFSDIALRWRARSALDTIYRHIAPLYGFKNVSKRTTRGVMVSRLSAECYHARSF